MSERLTLPLVERRDWVVNAHGLVVPEECERPSVGDIRVFARERELFVPPSSEVLQQEALPVTEELIASGGLERVVNKMKRAAGVGKQRRLVGIAAPQVGEPYCVVAFYPNLGQPDKPQELVFYINPTYEPLDEGEYGYLDACFSTEGAMGWGLRWKAIEVKSDNQEPVILVDDLQQFPRIPARVGQHEIDHVNGIMWPDRLAEAIAARDGAEPWWPHGITVEHWQNRKANNVEMPLAA